MTPRTAIGGLLLETVEGWAFSVRDGVVVGRRGKQPGILRITNLSMNQLKQPLSHEKCMSLAADWIDAPEAKAFDVLTLYSATGPTGSASFRRRKDQICVWYCTRPAGLIMGAYACPVALCTTPEYRFLRAQCARMIATALFDRIAWGGDDELTRFLVTHLAEADAEEDAVRPVPRAPLADKRSEQSTPQHIPKRRRS